MNLANAVSKLLEDGAEAPNHEGAFVNIHGTEPFLRS
jgi:hypothetical protein